MAVEELGLAIAVEGLNKFLVDMDKSDKAIGGTEKKWTGLSGIAGKAGKVLLGVGKILGGVVVAGAVAAGAAIVGIAVGMGKLAIDGFKMAVDFQSQMATLAIAASSTGLSFDELHDAALAVGGDTRLLGVSATGAADAMTGLYKAGLDTGAIFGDLNGYMNEGAELGGALKAAIDLAAASELDMVQASDLAVVALSTFGDKEMTAAQQSEFINDAMNNMVQAADASVTSVSSLGEALKMVGPTAGAMGIGIEDVNNALALLSGAGIEGSMAGSSLNRMLLDLTKTTPKATAMMDKLGISVYDQEGAMLPLVDIIGQFEDSLIDATEAEKNEAMQAIFTAQGQRGMNTLLEQGAGGWRDMALATANAATIQEQAAAKGATFAGQMESLEGAIETVKIGIGEAFLPVASAMVEWFSEMVDEHGPALQAIFEQIGAILAEYLPIAMEIIIQKGGELIAWWQENWPAIQATITEVWAAIEPVLMTIISWLTNEGPTALSGLQLAFAEAWASIQESTFTAVAFLQGIIQPFLDAITAWWDEHGQNVITIVTWLWDMVVSMVTQRIAVIQAVIQAVLAIVQGIWDVHGAAIMTVVGNLWDMLVQLTSIGMEYISNIIDAVAAAIRGDWTTFGEEIRANWGLIWDAIKTILSTAGENLRAIMDSIMASLKGAFTQVDWQALGSSIIEGVKRGVTSAAGALKDAVKNAAKAALAAAKAALGIGSPSRVFRVEVGQQISAGIAQGVSDLTPMVQAQVQAAISPVAMMSGAAAATNISSTTNKTFNLTTNSMTRPGGLEMEFSAMSMASR